MPAEFSIVQQTPSNGWREVALTGELDLAVSGALAQFLATLDGRVRVDCSELDFLDAAGLRALLEAAARLEHLELVHVGPAVRRVLDATGTTQLLEAGHPHAQPPEDGIS